jgi:hypothetical protein
MLHCWDEAFKISGKRKGAFLALALALAYLESVGGVVSPNSREDIIGAHFVESRR